jgi:TrpR-related protein YerC/YecD
MKNIRTESIEKLLDAIKNIENKDDLFEFFVDVLTIKELKDMGDRFEAAIMLKNGDNYEAITKKLGLSSATISRVSKCINYGNGGYAKAIQALEMSNENT